MTIKTVGSKPKNIKLNNKRLILQYIYENRNATIQEISDATKLSKTTINKLVADLAQTGLIYSLGKGDSTAEGGRKPEIFSFNEKYKYIVSIEMDYQGLYIQVMDMFCNEIYNNVEIFDDNKPYQYVLEKTSSELADILESVNLTFDNVYCVVLDTYGITDAAGGIIKNSLSFWENDIPVLDDFKKSVPDGVNVIVNNASRFSGYAELLNDKSLKNQRIVTFLMWDQWIGGSVIQQGEFVEGTNGLVGEMGHLVVRHSFSKNPGKQDGGQLETLISSDGIVNYAVNNIDNYQNSALYEKAKSGEIAAADIISAAADGDEFAVVTVKRSAYYLACAIHNVCFIYDADTVILQGFYAELGDEFIEWVYEYLQDFISLYDIKSKLKIRHSSLDYHVAFHQGAGYYAINDFLKNIK